jgi:hypothetical protein
MQFREALLAPAVLKFRKHAESNTSIHTTRLSDRNFSYSLSPDEKVPAARPWLPSSPMMYRAKKVLGRAMLTVRTGPHRFWMLLFCRRTRGI